MTGNSEVRSLQYTQKVKKNPKKNTKLYKTPKKTIKSTDKKSTNNEKSTVEKYSIRKYLENTPINKQQSQPESEASNANKKFQLTKLRDFNQ